MSQKQIQRIKVIENAAEGRISVAQAAELRYTGFNDTHLTEKLNTVDKLKVSRATVQRILRVTCASHGKWWRTRASH